MSKFSGALTVFIASFMLFLSAECLMVEFYQTATGMPMPKIAILLEWVTPFSHLIYIWPLGAAIVFWLNRSPQPNDYACIVVNILISIFSIFVATVAVMHTETYACLDFTRPISTGKIIGNIIIGVLLLLGIVIGIKNHRHNTNNKSNPCINTN